MTRTLSAESVACAYDRERPVFTRLEVTVRSGELVGFAGPNGSGKSTLLRVLCGLLKPKAGRVTLDGRVLASFGRRERARVIAFLPQAVNPAFTLSVFEVVCLGRYPHLEGFGAMRPRDKEVVERCLHATETEELRARDFMTLSGGERQRVLLASILAQEPDLLLLDEPTSALDIHHQIEIFALLERLARRGYGIAAVTHDLNLAARFCDRLVLLAKGRDVVAAGPPGEVLTAETLSDAYGAAIRVVAHPGTGTPLVWAETPSRMERDS
ncbi:MAG TPA: heme ABC transporter ATP-binding protein [Candidatus Hydrogenedentes bacterium]|nr:heme ABC transporter ATP-binding protein [Candidatus Hydrogenedentota bacterium]HOV72862.1 heme ABC transporter ATP-binding protein [Candidatus Hydrogenedentota bacterium]HPC16399.1 heme ABC transporter ATP-binding protein [Candidatus Hydrogenedentota bacterium]HRT20332.1 heme ABC transporter ATP-binding protein [Candidatus Hydrogenedentota bacterium]HRT65058.1 heme ABC transporter ATP-binding protein [Candidatus Hydrogenedentota bacterium]